MPSSELGTVDRVRWIYRVLLGLSLVIAVGAGIAAAGLTFDMPLRSTPPSQQTDTYYVQVRPEGRWAAAAVCLLCVMAAAVILRVLRRDRAPAS